MRCILRWGCALTVALATPSGVAAQDLADLDYDNLSFRGLGFEVGYLFPNRIENTESYGVRFDLGYLGPGLRIVPTITYWSSPFRAAEVAELENRVAGLVVSQAGPPLPTVDLGTIKWSDVALTLDGHVVWEVPFDMLTFAGLGVSAHVLNGDGAAINGTFIEDLLDTVTAGFNLHAGLEYPMTDRVRVHGQGRYEVLEDLQYFQLKFGFQLMTGPNAPGEGPGS